MDKMKFTGHKCHFPAKSLVEAIFRLNIGFYNNKATLVIFQLSSTLFDKFVINISKR
jgi:hypothetical protein